MAIVQQKVAAISSDVRKFKSEKAQDGTPGSPGNLRTGGNLGKVTGQFAKRNSTSRFMSGSRVEFPRKSPIISRFAVRSSRRT